jgi:hypothetical protein
MSPHSHKVKSLWNLAILKIVFFHRCDRFASEQRIERNDGAQFAVCHCKS